MQSKLGKKKTSKSSVSEVVWERILRMKVASQQNVIPEIFPQECDRSEEQLLLDEKDVNARPCLASGLQYSHPFHPSGLNFGFTFSVMFLQTLQMRLGLAVLLPISIYFSCSVYCFLDKLFKILSPETLSSMRVESIVLTRQ